MTICDICGKSSPRVQLTTAGPGHICAECMPPAAITMVPPDSDSAVAQPAPMSPPDVYRHLATTDPARPCRDLLGILGAIRNVAARREPPTAVANILAELRRMDIAERRAKRTPPRYDDVYRAGVEAMATACNCGGRSCPDCGDDDARFS